MDRVYLLMKENYEGDFEAEVFETEEKAQKELREIKRENRNQDEYEEGDDWCSWFNADYNSYSTHVYIREEKIQ